MESWARCDLIVRNIDISRVKFFIAFRVQILYNFESNGKIFKMASQKEWIQVRVHWWWLMEDDDDEEEYE